MIWEKRNDNLHVRTQSLTTATKHPHNSSILTFSWHIPHRPRPFGASFRKGTKGWGEGRTHQRISHNYIIYKNSDITTRTLKKQCVTQLVLNPYFILSPQRRICAQGKHPRPQQDPKILCGTCPEACRRACPEPCRRTQDDVYWASSRFLIGHRDW
jgi:hypothetical protein